MEIAKTLGFVGWIVIITAIITGLRLGKGKKGRGIRTLQFTVSCYFIYVFVGSFFVVLAQGVMDFLAFLLFAALLILPILGLRGFVKWYKNAPAAEEKTSQTEKQTLAPTPASEAEKQTPEGKTYYERDNMGTRHDTMSQATAYWMGERMGLKVKPPFTLYIMPSIQAGEEALLELPFMHRAADSGKLISERLMTFGVYATTSNGVPDGQCEAMITGSDLTLDEYKTVEAAMTRLGGTCKNHSEPSASVKSSDSAGDASRVVYAETVKGNDGVSVYEVYKGPDKASAMAFLKGKPVTTRMYYVVVDTPEGSFGRDINGFYQE